MASLCRFWMSSEMGMGAGADEIHRNARLPCPAGPADAMRVVGRGARQVEIHDHRQLHDVESARGHVRGEQHLQLAFLEIGQRLRPGALAQFAVQRPGLEAGFAQFLGDVLGRVLGRHENQHARPAFRLDQVAQQLRAPRRRSTSMAR